MICSFCSYTGGVWPTMALANVGKLLFMRGLRVLMVDCDLEAPQLENYFFHEDEQLWEVLDREGLTEIIQRYLHETTADPIARRRENQDAFVKAVSNKRSPITDYLITVDGASPNSAGNPPGLWLLPAGRRSPKSYSKYIEKVRELDRTAFATAESRDVFSQWLRQYLLSSQMADVVLISARRGIFEPEGLTSPLVADVVVLFCEPDQQILRLTEQMADSLLSSDNRLETVIVPCPVDDGEISFTTAFKHLFQEKTSKFLPNVFQDSDVDFWALRIPYVPKYSYSTSLSIGADAPSDRLNDALRRLVVSLAMLSPESSPINCEFSQGFQKSQGNPVAAILYSEADGEEFGTLLHNQLHERLPHFRFLLIGVEQKVSKQSCGVEVPSELRGTNRLLWVLTPNSVHCSAIRRRLRYARQQGIPVFPVLGANEVDLAKGPKWLKSTQLYNFDSEKDFLVETLEHSPRISPVPHVVPAIFDGYVQRELEYGQLKSLVLETTRGRSDLTKVLVTGTAGAGKTELAKALCHDEAVGDAFDEGIVWVTLGQTPKLIMIIEEIIDAFHGPRTHFFDLEQAAFALAKVLEGRFCLLVLDDVWKASDLAPFLMPSKSCVRLITTRVHDVVEQAAHVEVSEMDLPQAVSVLTSAFEKSTFDLKALEHLANCVTRWPLVLGLARKTLRNFIGLGYQFDRAVAQTVEQLLRHGITAFDREDSPERHSSIALSLEASLSQLRDRERDLFLRMAVFPQKVEIPIEVLCDLWELDEPSTVESVHRFANSSLLRFDPRNGRVRLPEILRSYLKAQKADFFQFHGKLVHSWCDLSNLPYDYAWKWMVYHLLRAGHEELVTELLFDMQYLHRYLVATSPGMLIESFNTMLEFLDSNAMSSKDACLMNALKITRNALCLSSNVIESGPQQLNSQLTGRLMDFNDVPQIASLLASSQGQPSEPSIAPRNPCLIHPGGALMRTLVGHSEWVNTVALTSDGRHALSGSRDATLKIWDTKTGDVLQTLRGHFGPVCCAAITPDGRTAISFSEDNTFKLWDFESGELIKTVETAGDLVTTIESNADGTQVVFASVDGFLRVMDLHTGEEVRCLGNDSETKPITCSALIPRLQRALVGFRDGSLSVWDLVTGQVVQKFEEHTKPVTCVDVAPTGSRAVSGSDDTTLVVWDLEMGVVLQTLNGHTDWVKSVSISSDGEYAISASWDQTLILWDLRSGELLRTFEGHSEPVSTVAMSQDARIAVSGSLDNTLRLWNVWSKETTPLHKGHTSGMSAIAVTSDAKLAVSGSWDKNLMVWDVQTGQVLRTLSGHTWTVSAVGATTEGNRVVSASGDGTLKVWQIETGKQLKTIKGHTEAINCLAVAREVSTAVSGSAAGTVKVWDFNQDEPIRVIEGHEEPVTCIAVTSDGTRAVSGSEDHTLKVWELQTGRLLHTVGGYTDWIRSVEFMADSNTIVSGTSAGLLKVWSLQNAELLASFEAHKDSIKSTAATPDGKYYVTASLDRTLKVWSTNSGKCVATFTADFPLLCCSVGLDNRTIVAGDVQGRFYSLLLTVG